MSRNRKKLNKGLNTAIARRAIAGTIKNDKKDKRYNSQIVYPIISNGDSIGTVILLSKEASTKMTDVEAKVAQSAASFLGSQMEI